MLLPPKVSEQFLRAYKGMLSTVAGRKLGAAAEFIQARQTFFKGDGAKHPPTDDEDLLQALREAVFGKFVLARHMARHSEFIGGTKGIYRVVGITTELKDMAPEWTLVETVVMKFKEHWICDGLIVPLNIHIGPGMKKQYMEQLRGGAKKSAGPSEDLKLRMFTPKQGQYLSFIYYYTKINGQPPAEADMVRYFRVSAPSVHEMVVMLERRGFIKRIAGKGRSITLVVPKEELPELE